MIEVVRATYKDRATVGYSYDDAGIGALKSKKAVLYDIPSTERQKYIDWFALHYPGTRLQWVYSFALSKWPAETHAITQFFGERVEYYKEAFGLCCGHNGVDFATITGSSVFAVADGTISSIGDDPTGYGTHVRMQHGNGFLSLYGHLSRVSVHVGQLIKAGSLIGFSGNTGVSTGPHLHFEIRKDNKSIDPLPLLDSIS
jgi:murein DD-endopeptidase MepM/ murein hydrolase activator NlpD